MTRVFRSLSTSSRTAIVVGTLAAMSICSEACSSDASFTLNGIAEKGPFAAGSSVTMSGGGTSGLPTHTTIDNELGMFRFEVAREEPLWLKAEGFFFDEGSGVRSIESVALDCLVAGDADSPHANVNVLTHMILPRVRALQRTGGMSMGGALVRADDELQAALRIGPEGFRTGVPSALLSVLDGNGDENAYLFAVELILVEAAAGRRLEEGTTGALQGLLDQIALDLRDDGRLHEELLAELEAAERLVPSNEVVGGLREHLERNGWSGSLPDPERILDSDLDGTVNAFDLCPSDPDPEQLDVDGDGVGDVCDCAPLDAALVERCTPPLPFCGDGRVDETETCDDAGESASCDGDCTLAECGDGHTNQAAGEGCDEAGATPTCSADCGATPCGVDPLPLSLDAPLQGDSTGSPIGIGVSCDATDAYPTVVHTLEVVEGGFLTVELELPDDDGDDVPDWQAVLSIRSTCSEDGSELGCTDGAGRANRMRRIALCTEGPQTLAVVASGADRDGLPDDLHEGRYTLIAHLVACADDEICEPRRGCVPIFEGGESCEDAVELELGSSVFGTTRGHVNDLEGCGAEGRGPDVVYQVTTANRGMLSYDVEPMGEDVVRAHVRADCGEQADPEACGEATCVEAGSHAIVVSSMRPADFQITASFQACAEDRVCRGNRCALADPSAVACSPTIALHDFCQSDVDCPEGLVCGDAQVAEFDFGLFCLEPCEPTGDQFRPWACTADWWQSFQDTVCLENEAGVWHCARQTTREAPDWCNGSDDDGDGLVDEDACSWAPVGNPEELCGPDSAEPESVCRAGECILP